MILNVYFHLVLNPKLECAMNSEEMQQNVHTSIKNIINKGRNRAIMVNGTYDHVHILFSPNPHKSVEDIINAIKSSTQADPDIIKHGGNFEWQEGYLLVTVGLSELKKLGRYIKTQEEIHKEISFRDEYIALLNEHQIEYEENGLPDFHD
jgi:REP element-mobilizing transposase RayT